MKLESAKTAKNKNVDLSHNWFGGGGGVTTVLFVRENVDKFGRPLTNKQICKYH